MKALGRVLNVVPAASGVGIKLTNATAVTYVTYEDDGTTIATITQRDSTGVKSEIALDCDVYPHKAPGTGGTWTAMSEQDDTLALGADTTNDAMCFTIDAAQLAAGYDSVEVTVDGGICVAILHDLTVQRKPSNLASPVL
ncbi:hypothetical protein ABZW49_20095 [Nonomuraea wenchangensis]